MIAIVMVGAAIGGGMWLIKWSFPPREEVMDVAASVLASVAALSVVALAMMGAQKMMSMAGKGFKAVASTGGYLLAGLI